MKQNKKVLISFVWRILERSGAQIVSFVVSIILARILDPNQYGVLALVTVLINIMQVFVDSGLGSALVQKKNADDLDFSSVFYFNMCVCLCLYAIMFLSAPLVAKFYRLPELTAIVRVLSLVLVFYGIKNIQHAYVYRQMRFKFFFFATISGTLGSGVIGIIMALRGFGVWALVAQHLSSTIIDTLVLWITVKWYPKWAFSWNRLKGLLSFGWKILATSLFDTVYNNIQQVMIGKFYATADLAYFSKGKQFPYMIINNVVVAVDSVLLPSMSKEQDNMERIHGMLRRAMKTGTFIMTPLLVGLAIVAKPTVCLLLTEKWMGAVPFLQMYCMIYLFYPIQSTTMNALKAIGRSDAFLKIEVLKKIAGIFFLIVLMKQGVMAIATGILLTSIFGFTLNAKTNKMIFGYSYFEQFFDIIPNIMVTLIMAVSIFWISNIGLNVVFTLLLQVALGVISYVVASFVTSNDSMKYLCRMIFHK